MKAVSALFLVCLLTPAFAQERPLAEPGLLVQQFSENGDRAAFLKLVKDKVAANAAGWYDKEFASLIEGFEKEPAPPAGYDKPPERRTQAEAIAAWVFDLRDVSSGGWFDGEAQARLSAAGPAAMDALVAALDDDTPTRSMGFEAGLSLNVLLRRNDLALACIERIAGITFFRRTQGRGGHFHNDAQRASVVANVHTWWAQAKGKSQADGIRIQLAIWKQNATLADQPVMEPMMLFTLVQLETPERVINRLRALCAADSNGLNSPITEGMLRLDPQFLLRTTFARLAADQVRGGDYLLLLQYGDKKIYQELGRRAQEGKFDPGSWSAGEQATRAAQFGKNWAMPFVAAMLSQTEMTGSRGFGSGPSQRFCAADDAVTAFQELTGRDFGYRWETSEEARLAAIGKARDWWNSEGKTAMAEKIAADHSSETDGTDLLATDEQIAATVARLRGTDAEARAAVGALGKVFSWRVQEALVARLSAEREPAQRVVILKKVGTIGSWLAPALAAVFEKDASLEVRAAAGETLVALFKSESWQYRLETREAALQSVRRVADATPPAELSLSICRVLIVHNAFEDVARIRALAQREPAKSDPEVTSFMQTWDAARGPGRFR